MITIEIDEKQVQIEQGSMLIEAIDAVSIPLPRFCYHKKLSVAANCRMCLVEVQNVGKPVPACATPVTDGMKVFTKSAKAREAQQSVMEFLLINHPLDCPICDQGGECELQDVSMGYGADSSRYDSTKRSVYDHDIGPLIKTFLTRCILCTRCVRFGQEIAGVMELGDIGRGEHSEIAAFVGEAVNSELSGNMIDLCPVGALTSKPFMYKARAWEMQQHSSIAPHDCVGSNLNIHVRRNQVMRVLPQHNEEVNENWISDRDRFSYAGLYHQQRATTPMIKVDGKWQEVNWREALEFVATGLRQFSARIGIDKLIGLAASNSSVEEYYLFQKLLRDMGCNNVDYRIRQLDFSDDGENVLYPGSDKLALAELEEQDAVLVVGSNPRKEAPLLNNRLRKACENNDAKLVLLNPVKYDTNFVNVSQYLAEQGDLLQELAAITKCLLEENKDSYQELQPTLAAVAVSEQAQATAKLLSQAAKSTIIIGELANNHPHAADIRRFTIIISNLSKSTVLVLAGANAVGAELAGMVPHKNLSLIAASSAGKNAADALYDQDLQGYILYNLEPEYDSIAPGDFINKLQQAELVINCTPFVSDAMLEYSDVILPIAPFTETSGTFVNIEKRWQSFTAVSKAEGASRPGWKVLRALGSLLELPDFAYNSSQEVLSALQEKLQVAKSAEKTLTLPTKLKSAESKTPVIIYQHNIYKNDNLVRRSAPLAATLDGKLTGAYLNSATARSLGLNNDDGNMLELSQHNNASVVPYTISAHIPENVILVILGDNNAVNLGAPYQPTDVKQQD